MEQNPWGVKLNISKLFKTQPLLPRSIYRARFSPVSVRTASSFPSLSFFPLVSFSQALTRARSSFCKNTCRIFFNDETIITDNETADVLFRRRRQLVYSLESSKPAKRTWQRAVEKFEKVLKILASQNILLHIFIIF